MESMIYIIINEMGEKIFSSTVKKERDNYYKHLIKEGKQVIKDDKKYITG